MEKRCIIRPKILFSAAGLRWENTEERHGEIYVNSDLMETVNGELSWTVTDVQGKTVSKGKEKAEINAAAAGSVF